MTYDLVCESFSSIDGMPFSILVTNGIGMKTQRLSTT